MLPGTASPTRRQKTFAATIRRSDDWSQLIGFDNRNFRYREGLKLRIEVGDDKHAVTQGVRAFDITDEGYVLRGDYDGQGAVLLTVDHEDAMEQVAWARQHGKCRVFCLALGHDNEARSNPGFREILRRGIAWSAGKTVGGEKEQGRKTDTSPTR